MSIQKFFWLMMCIMVYGLMMPADSVFAMDQIVAQIDGQQGLPQDSVQPLEANPRHEPEQIEEPERVDPPPQIEEQPQPNEPDEIEQPAPLNQ